MTTEQLIEVHAKIKRAESGLAKIFQGNCARNPALSQSILNIQGELLCSMALIEDNIHERATG